MATATVREKLFKCEECGKGYTTQKYVWQHIREVHGNDRSFKCPECDRTFKRKGELSKHVKFVHFSANDDTPSPLTKCPQCGKMVKWIKEHLKVVHENEKLVHKCLECNKGFLSRSSLVLHMRMHTGERPFQCEYCLQTYQSASGVKAHENEVHLKEKSFKCDECPVIFTRQHTLKLHIKAVHRQEKPFKCEVCLKDFTRKCHLLTHLKIHRKGPSGVTESQLASVVVKIEDIEEVPAMIGGTEDVPVKVEDIEEIPAAIGGTEDVPIKMEDIEEGPSAIGGTEDVPFKMEELDSWVKRE